MKISSKYLYEYLISDWDIEKAGNQKDINDLQLPTFAETVTPEDGGLYFADNTDILKKCTARCLFIISSENKSNIPRYCTFTIFYVNYKDNSKSRLFNDVQNLFGKIINWSMEMQKRLDICTDIQELIQISIPIFENRISVTDYNFRSLGMCESTGEGENRRVVIIDQHQIPEDVVRSFADVHESLNAKHEPFIFSDYYRGRLLDRYCINLYVGEIYYGCCALSEDMRPVTNSDYILFEEFSAYICAFLARQSTYKPDQFITLKTIFNSLLEEIPISKKEKEYALLLQERNLQINKYQYENWFCVVIKHLDKGKSLPADYLCTSIESRISRCTAVPYKNYIAVLYMLSPHEEIHKVMQDCLIPFLENMHLQAGVSTIFSDIFDAANYCSQALAALKCIVDKQPPIQIIHFEDIALEYILKNSTGGFDPKLMLTPGMINLLRISEKVDYWGTLKCYLDNACNIAITTRKLYIHRSTLIYRLEKIEEYVRLDTAEDKLYAQICTHLVDRKI